VDRRHQGIARRCLPPAIGLLLCAAASGCVDYHWEFDPRRAAARAQEEGKDLFIYFRSGFSFQCGQMEREVLLTPEVAELFQNSVNCQLEYFWFADVAAKYGVRDVPSYVIVRPDGKQWVRTGYMPREQFIAFAQAALGTLPPTSTRKAAHAAGR
jgi:thioredoxin-related protein